MTLRHPGQYLQQELLQRGWTQKEFARLLGKKVSEVNELIKGKRNITVQWDILLSILFDDPEKKWIALQMEYDYNKGKSMMDSKKLEEIMAKKNGEQKNTQEKIDPPKEIPSQTEKSDKSKQHKIFNEF